MKIRNSFVSNSSSSSFVVRRAVYDFGGEGKRYIFFLSREEEEVLKKEGFVLSDSVCPQQAYFEYWAEMNYMVKDEKARAENFARLALDAPGFLEVHKEAEKDENKNSFILNVVCNEIEVIESLVKKNISFYADLHCESCSMLFTADKKNPEDGKITIASNFGKDMYFNQHKKPTEKPYVAVTVKEFRKQGCNYHKFLRNKRAAI